MKIFKNEYQDIKIDEPLTVTIGNFDGLHVGHQKLLQTTKTFTDTKSAVITFSPHPISVISGIEIPTLSNDEEKIELIRKEDIDYLMIVSFTKTFAKLSVDEFIDFLKNIHIRRIVVGRDFKFAYRGSGNIEHLKQYFEVIVMPDFIHNQTRVSSSFVKQLLDYGNLDEVKTLLNRPYQLTGKVVDGDKVGRTLGYPTANLDYKNAYLPKNGIYYVRVFLENQIYDGVLNLGHNPTVNFSARKRVEVYILDFDRDIYGKTITIEFIKYLREEMKFATIESLLQQMAQDVKNARLHKI